MSRRSPSNPFTVRGRVRDPEKFFGRERELMRVFDLLNTMQSISLVGERRIGKSSLLYYVFQKTGERLGKDFQAIYTDLPDVTDEQSFYKCLCKEIGYSGDKFSDLDRCIRKRKVIACLDEFEGVASRSSFSRNFFDSLRSLAQSGNLALLVATEHSLTDLCQDEKIATSPFWNIFTRTNLGLFKENEAERLVRAGFAGAAVEIADSEVSRLLELAGQYPFFLQRACYYLFEQKIGQATLWEHEFETDVADYLHYLWHKLNKTEQAALRWSLGFGGQSPDEAILTNLERRGLLITVKKQFGYWPFSEAFEAIVRNPPSKKRKNKWWSSFFSRFKSGKFTIGPTGVSAELHTKDSEDKR